MAKNKNMANDPLVVDPLGGFRIMVCQATCPAVCSLGTCEVGKICGPMAPDCIKACVEACRDQKM